MDFSTISAVVMDMDGVLWRGDEALPGLLQLFAMLHDRNIPFSLATNNSSKSRADYVQKLKRMGVMGVSESQVETSGTATASYLQAQYPAGTPVYVLGGAGLRQVLTEVGFTLADKDVQAVVVGLDPQLTYDRLKQAALLIRSGAAFVASNEDATYPVPEGLAPGAGSIVAALKTATDREPISMGKPNAPLFEASLRRLKTSPEKTLMIGDRLSTDILGAQRLGLRTAMMLTGVSTREDIITSGIQPDAVFEDLNALIAAWV